MRSIKVLTAALFASLAAGIASAQPIVARAPSANRARLALFVGVGMLGAAAGGVLAYSLTGSTAAAEAPVAAIADKPARPSPIRPGITTDIIANLFPPESADGVANSAHHA